MEPLCLLFSIISTFLTSLLHSLILLFRTLLARRRTTATSTSSVSLYEGTVWHERRRPVHHSFRYSVRYALFNLDIAPNVPPDHLCAEEARRLCHTNGPVLLLTIPPSVGYEQNPLSLYYCYDEDDSDLHLRKCIAEVTNTPWGERVRFVFNPDSDLVAKPLHVSPFMDMLGNWSIKANAPGDNLSVFISVQHPELGNYFVAMLKAKRIPTLTDHSMFFWLMPHKVALWIYWHAIKLWWKNVQFFQHPRYSNPNYREEALIRDQELQCSQGLALGRDQRSQAEANDPGYLSGMNCGRWIKWRDAKWPWC